MSNQPSFFPSSKDPRIPFAGLLTLYAALGCTVLGFNRSPTQMLLTLAAGLILEVGLHRLIKGEYIFPLSAYISCASLSLLLNYSHNYWLLFLPVFFTIAPKYVFTFKGRHVFNPSMFAVVAAIKLGGGLFASAPAYQWGGSIALVAFMVTAAFVLFMGKIRRTPLVLSFLFFYALQVAYRAYVTRWHLPAETLVLGTLTSPAFYLFTFFMITDPKTSPDSPWAQVAWSFLITLVDLGYHMVGSLSTIFFALFTLSAARLVWLHARELFRTGPIYFKETLLSPRWLRGLALTSSMAGAGYAAYALVIHPIVQLKPGFRFEPIPAEVSGITSKMGRTLEEVDPRVRHIAKWLLAVGDSIAVGDFDNDGRLDIFLSNPLKRPEDRNALYRNLGGFRFQRVDIPALREISRHPEKYGLVTGALFVDYDNSGAQSLFLPVAYGKSRLLKNRLPVTGKAEFKDVTDEAGIREQTVAISATFFDYDRDGKLDLVIGNAINPYLPDYKTPTPLSIFKLPEPSFPGDRRMFHFMHHSWNNAENGGLNVLFHNEGGGRFAKQDIKAMGMPQTHWTMSAGTGDLNQDGWTDLYLASDFGPDDLYLNDHGKRFVRVQGKTFGSIGKDTYKGMNVSIGDLDNNGWLDIHVSNVHEPLQAEGSLLWMVTPNPKDPFTPFFEDEATLRGALNERRFGWGAAMGDLNLDGWLDMVQANGMVDDSPDKRFAKPKSYWYSAQKIMMAGPDLHSYADRWADLRGYSIFGKEANRVYLSRGDVRSMQFADVASQVGLTELTNSRGAALADFDNDGALDLAVTHQFASLSLYRNTILDAKNGVRPHFIGFALKGDGRKVSREAVGTQARLTCGGKTQLREVQIANGFSAQGDRRLHYGLASCPGPARLEVSWYGAEKRVYEGLALDRYYTLTYGEPAARPQPQPMRPAPVARPIMVPPPVAIPR